MTTPTAVDVAPYVDLTLLDVDPQELVERAMAALAILFPDWTPREGTIEAELVEAVALEVAELVYAINRLPGTVAEVLLRLFGLTRDAGIAPKGAVTFATSNTGDTTIPAGTAVSVDPGGGNDAVTFATDVDLLVVGGTGGGTVAATATDPTDTVNTAAAGTTAQLLDAVSYVDSATIAITTGGTAPEDGPAFLTRGVARLRRLVTTLTLAPHFTAAALEDVRVSRATTLDEYDPAVGPAPGDNLGHVTVVVTGPGGIALDAPTKADLESTLEAQAVAGLDVHMLDATVTALTVTTTVVRTGIDVDPVALAATITTALDAYLNPDAWPFGGTVYVNELIPILDAIPGVARVTTVTLTGAPLDGAGNATLPGYGPLAKLGAADVTVTGP